MILTPDEAKGLAPDLANVAADLLEFQLEGIEQAIKGETNNDFSRFADETGEIQWPADVKMGVLGLLKYANSTAAAKASQGIASETISRHSVTYSQPGSAETAAGFPASLMVFLDPYRRARF